MLGLGLHLSQGLLLLLLTHDGQSVQSCWVLEDVQQVCLQETTCMLEVAVMVSHISAYQSV